MTVWGGLACNSVMYDSFGLCIVHHSDSLQEDVTVWEAVLCIRVRFVR